MTEELSSSRDLPQTAGDGDGSLPVPAADASIVVGVSAEVARAAVRDAVTTGGGMASWAAKHGMSAEYVRLVLNGHREPAKAVLDAIGWERVSAYRERPTAVANICPCFACTKARVAIDPGPMMFGQSVAMMRMFLCETCGNKRCPHAADHRHVCTDSNEPGQAGSLYTDAPTFAGGMGRAPCPSQTADDASGMTQNPPSTIREA